MTIKELYEEAVKRGIEDKGIFLETNRGIIAYTKSIGIDDLQERGEKLFIIKDNPRDKIMFL